MTDNIDIKVAADRLQRALMSLEAALDPMVTKLTSLEKAAQESGDFAKDRAELARQLDESTAREKEFEAREAEFSDLAADTTQELDRVIRQVREVLGQEK